MLKVSDEQKKVIKEIASRGGFVGYYKGGFWSSPGQSTVTERFGAPSEWHTTKQTVAAMERKGLLEKTASGTNYDVSKFPGLEDRKLTALALTFLGPVAFSAAK